MHFPAGATGPSAAPTDVRLLIAGAICPRMIGLPGVMKDLAGGLETMPKLDGPRRQRGEAARKLDMEK